MPFAATWMDLKIIISEVSQRQILYDITYMQNIKNSSNELIYKIEIDSQIQKTNYCLPKRRDKGEGGKSRVEDSELQTTIYIKGDKQQVYIVQHMELQL